MSKKDFLINTMYYSIIILMIYLSGKYILPIMMPFIIGFLIAYIVRKISLRIFGDLKKRGLILILVCFYIVVVFIFTLISVITVNSVTGFDYAGLYSNYLEPAVNIVYNFFIELNEALPYEVAEIFNQVTASIFEAIKTLLMTLSTYLINFVKGVITSFPSVIITVTVTIVSSIYMLLDFEGIVVFMYKILPAKVLKLLEDAGIFIRENILNVLKSYIIIMGITFVELTIGLTILKAKPTILLAALIAIMDILPILGVGTALIPWAFVEMIFGNILKGFGVLALYATITVIRNIIEPRIVGIKLGLNPLVSLISMIAGLKLFGLAGMIGFPLIISFFLYRDDKKTEVAG
ncbi:MAG: AI-2E family transporter [Erysipelotrichaceae bacterium]